MPRELQAQLNKIKQKSPWDSLSGFTVICGRVIDCHRLWICLWGSPAEESRQTVIWTVSRPRQCDRKACSSVKREFACANSVLHRSSCKIALKRYFAVFNRYWTLVSQSRRRRVYHHCEEKMHAEAWWDTATKGLMICTALRAVMIYHCFAMDKKIQVLWLGFFGAANGTWTHTSTTHAPQTCLYAYSSTAAYLIGCHLNSFYIIAPEKRFVNT